MNKEHFLASGLLEQYALGITTEEEGQVVERYLEAFPDIRKEYTAMRKALDQYASQYASQPPEALRTRIMDAVEEEAIRENDFSTSVPGQGNSRLQQSGWSRYLSYAAILALGVGLFFMDRKNTHLEQDLMRKNAELTTCQAEQQALQAANNLYAFLKHGATQQVRLTGLADEDALSALAYWNEQEGKAFFNPIALPPAPQGKQYQIWADVKGEMISVGLLAEDFRSDRLASIEFLPNAESLNITLEPAGGSKKPTVANLLANGKI